MIGSMTMAELREANGLVSDILDDLSIQKASESSIERFQKLYTRSLKNILEERMDAVEKILDRELKRVMDEARRILGPELAKELEPATRRYLERAFKAGQAVRGVGRNIQTLFDKPRQDAVDWLVGHDRFWIGKVFPEHVIESFKETIVQGMKEGLGRKDIGKRLQKLMAGTPDAPGKIELYNRVAAASVNRANNWGGMFSLEAAGFEEYVFSAVMDERTSAICQSLNGMTFSVPRVMNMVRKALSGPPSAIEEISPWPTYDAERDDFFIETGGRRNYLSDKSSDWLADHGVALPPLHGSCRSTITVVI